MLYAEGKQDEALKAMSAAADAEDKTEKSRSRPDRSPRPGSFTVRCCSSTARRRKPCGVRGDDAQGTEPPQRDARRRRAAAAAGDNAKAGQYYAAAAQQASDASADRADIKKARAFVAAAK